MKIGPHSEEEIFRAARPLIGEKGISYLQENKNVRVVISLKKDNVLHGYDVYFKKGKGEDGKDFWYDDCIQNVV